MRRVTLDKATAGMILAQPVYGMEGQIVLNAGVELQDRQIEKLRDLQIQHLYVEEDQSVYIEAQDQEAQAYRYNLVDKAHQILATVQVGKYVETAQTKEQVIELLDELCQRRDMQPVFRRMQDCNDYLFEHSVTVFFLAMLLGIKAGYDKGRLRELGVGALLHDTGMIFIPPEILNKPAGLTPGETGTIKQHPDLGFRRLRENADISLLAAYCALQHHERWDGSGYPSGLKEGSIHEFGQIVGLVDTYSAMTVKTSYRPAIPVYQTLSIIQRGRQSYFNPQWVDLLTASVAVFPLGKIVKMSNQQIGVIRDYADQEQTKPIVQVCLDENKQKVDYLLTVDLTHNPSLYISDME